MSNFILSGVDDVVSVTLTNVPNTPEALADIFGAVAGINLDMICQTSPYKGRINLSFTIDSGALAATLITVGGIKEAYGDVVTEVSPGNCKFMLYSELLKTQSGVAARLFKALADNDLQIKLITTSDTEITILLESINYEKIKTVLEKEFCE